MVQGAHGLGWAGPGVRGSPGTHSGFSPKGTGSSCGNSCTSEPS